MITENNRVGMIRARPGSPADAATPLSPEPAFSSRVVRLGHAPSPEARTRLVVTAADAGRRAAYRRLTADGDASPVQADRPDQ
jgi:hypothetical protein